MGWVRTLVTSGAISLALAGATSAAEIKVLSAGAVEPGIRAAIARYKPAEGDTVTIRFATAPAILKLLAEGEAPDVLIAPRAVLEEAAKTGKVDLAAIAPVGKVGVGIAVRTGAEKPGMTTADDIKREITGAERIVYNQASTGNYLHGLLDRLGLKDIAAPKTTRYPDGDAVMKHLIAGTGREIGFGAITEILLYKGKGLEFIGPLPADIQNYTSYFGAAFVKPGAGEAAKRFIGFLATPEARRAFAENGVE